MNIPIWQNVPPAAAAGFESDLPYLTPYLVEGSRQAMIVFPGGGYEHLADHEGGPIAQWLNDHGISAFVLTYRIAPHKQPAALLDARRAVRYVRSHAEVYGIDADKIGILGFSAGGHLAAMTGVAFEEGDPESSDPIEQVSSRPDLMVLCYPVITMQDFTHAGSRHHLLGEAPTQALIDQFSAEQRVTSETPPAFIWHTADDQAVPVENSLQMALALGRYAIPYELHVFQKGRHGLGLALDEPDVAVWTDLCMTWLRKQGWSQSV